MVRRTTGYWCLRIKKSSRVTKKCKLQTYNSKQSAHCTQLTRIKHVLYSIGIFAIRKKNLKQHSMSQRRPSKNRTKRVFLCGIDCIVFGIFRSIASFRGKYLFYPITLLYWSTSLTVSLKTKSTINTYFGNHLKIQYVGGILFLYIFRTGSCSLYISSSSFSFLKHFRCSH